MTVGDAKLWANRHTECGDDCHRREHYRIFTGPYSAEWVYRNFFVYFFGRLEILRVTPAKDGDRHGLFRFADPRHVKGHEVWRIWFRPPELLLTA